MLTIASIPW
jgi:hypothetical protein